jgi:hypothetical protein
VGRPEQTNVNARLWRGLLTTPSRQHEAHEQRDLPAPPPRREAQRAVDPGVRPHRPPVLRLRRPDAARPRDGLVDAGPGGRDADGRIAMVTVAVLLCSPRESATE